MATTIRAEVSEKNPFHIEKHRYYELKHFCLQYPLWVKSYNNYVIIEAHPMKLANNSKCGFFKDNPTERIAMMKRYYSERIDMLKQAAEMTDKELSDYILKGVTEALSYDVLKIQTDIPCCRDTYYMLYRKFFWLLNRMRN